MATYKSGKGPRGGDYRKRDGWSGPRDHKSGSASPRLRRSNSPWHNNRSDHHKDHRDSQRQYVHYLSEEWKKVEQDLVRESQKDPKITHIVEYIEKTQTDIKADQLFNMANFLKSRQEMQSQPD